MDLLETQARLRGTLRMRIVEFPRSIARPCLALLRDPDRSSSGQSLVETALLLPMLLMLLFNAVNFGYFFLVALNLGVAPRNGVLYSVAGSATPGTLTLPSAGPDSSSTSVSYLTRQDLGSLSSS